MLQAGLLVALPLLSPGLRFRGRGDARSVIGLLLVLFAAILLGMPQDVALLAALALLMTIAVARQAGLGIAVRRGRDPAG